MLYLPIIVTTRTRLRFLSLGNRGDLISNADHRGKAKSLQKLLTKMHSRYDQASVELPCVRAGNINVDIPAVLSHSIATHQLPPPSRRRGKNNSLNAVFLTVRRGDRVRRRKACDACLHEWISQWNKRESRVWTTTLDTNDVIPCVAIIHAGNEKKRFRRAAVKRFSRSRFITSCMAFKWIHEYSRGRNISRGTWLNVCANFIDFRHHVKKTSRE